MKLYVSEPAPQRRGWIAVVPNVLSGARLALAAVFSLLPTASWPWVIIVAGLTDFVDGQIARRFGVTSWIGGLIDGIADKGFVVSVLVTFAVDGRLAAWMVVALLARDVTVGLIAGYAAAMRQWQAFHHMPARWAGKVTTALMFVMLVVMAAWPEAVAVRILVWCVIGLSISAAIDYAIVFARAETNRRRSGTVGGGWSGDSGTDDLA